MGKISKTGIAPQQQIKAEHITRIIDALSGESPDTQIEISGSVTASYFSGDGSGLTNLPIPSGSGSIYERITRSQAGLMFSSSLFIPGLNYTITDADVNLYGGTEITLTAITPSELSLQGSGKFYCPKYDVSAESTGYGIWTKQMEDTFSNIVGIFTPNEIVTANNGATAKYLAEGFLEFISGDWSFATSISGATATADVSGFVTPSYTVGQIVHWGGKSWTNVNGNIGASIDKYTLNAEWTEIPFNETDYNVYIDEIQYDFGNDMIIYRKDRYNNVVSGNNQVFVEFESPDGFGLGNPIKDFQWGCAQDDFNTNDYFFLGIQGNEVIDSYFETLNTRGRYIWFNKLSQQSFIIINTLSNSGYIYNNTLGDNSSIQYNTLSSNSSIRSNTLSSSSIQNNTLNSMSHIQYNTLSSSSIQNNTLSNNTIISSNTLSMSYIQYNTLSNGCYIYNNTLSDESYIDSNTLSSNSSIKSNTLSSSSSIQNSTLSSMSYIQYNTLSNVSSIQNNTLGDNSYIQFNTLSRSNFTFSNAVNITRCNANSFNIPGSTINLSGATIISSNYTKELFNRQDGTPRLQYVNNSDVIVITDVNA